MTEPAPDGVFRLMYRSHDLIPASERRTALGALFSEARAGNKARDVTGALLITDEWFVQVLEGERSVVQALYATIAADPRHDQVSLLDSRTVPQRVFSRWSMARVAEDGEHDIPLLATRRGIADAGGRGPTGEQQLLLDVMRDATTADAPV